LLIFARTLMKNPHILVLDEATSTLDNETERLVQDALSTVLTGRTSLVVAHRLSTIRHADQILVMDQGRIVERGTHDELIAAGGVYANLVAQQAGAVLRGGVPPERLRVIPLLADLDDRLIAALARQMTIERFPTGEAIVRQGDYGDSIYFIASGGVEVLVHDGERERRVGELGEGDYFGEMALLTGQPRSATVQTITPTEVFGLTQAAFAALLEREPALRDLLITEASHRAQSLAAAPAR
jgi:ATP-binding cassette, subfamily B, bacterial